MKLCVSISNRLMYLWYFQNLDDLNDKPAIHSFSEVDRKEHLNGFKIGSDASANEFNDKHGMEVRQHLIHKFTIKWKRKTNLNFGNNVRFIKCTTTTNSLIPFFKVPWLNTWSWPTILSVQCWTFVLGHTD